MKRETRKPPPDLWGVERGLGSGQRPVVPYRLLRRLKVTTIYKSGNTGW